VTDGPRLLIRLGSLGDVVLATAAANAAREAWGDGALDVLVKEEWSAVWDGHPAVRRVLAWPRRDRGPAGLPAMAARLRREGYRETIDLQGSPRTRLLTAAAGLRRVSRPRRRGLSRRLAVWTKHWGPPGDYRVVRSFVAARFPGTEALPSVHPGKASRDRAAALLGEAEGKLGLVPGARHVTKRWPLDRYVAVGRELVARGLVPVPVFFGPDEDALLDEWGERWPGEGEWIPVRGDLAVTAAALQRTAAVLTNDSGIMHLAAAVGTPVAAFFGPTVRSFGFPPAGPGHEILEVEGLGCRPCSLHGGSRCPRGHFRCMLDIDPSRALAVLESVRGRRGWGRAEAIASR
jgi:heptosyltransferase-2